MRLSLLLLALFAALSTTCVSGAMLGAQDGGNALERDTETTFTLPVRHEMPEKTVWPELVGQPAEAAKAALTAELPAGAQVLLVPEGSMMTMDFRTNRVRIVYNKESGKVVAAPRVG